MKVLQYIAVLALLLITLLATSCNTKRDCRGRIKHRLSNGVWI